MLWKKIIRNKYKSIAAILLLLLLADGLTHKGLVRVLLPASFADTAIRPVAPKEKVHFISSGKQWTKAVNTVDLVQELDASVPGFECDVYYDTAKHLFDVHHDADKSKGNSLDMILQASQAKKLDVSIWLDFKNCDTLNNKPALQTLLQLRDRYKLQDKILVESGNIGALEVFADSGFFTSYYTPFFNPYLSGKDSLRQWGQRISEKLAASKVSALSGYYFQYPFLKATFPEFPILTWSPKNQFSLVSWLYNRKINADPAVLINLR